MNIFHCAWTFTWREKRVCWFIIFWKTYSTYRIITFCWSTRSFKNKLRHSIIRSWFLFIKREINWALLFQNFVLFLNFADWIIKSLLINIFNKFLIFQLFIWNFSATYFINLLHLIFIFFIKHCVAIWMNFLDFEPNSSNFNDIIFHKFVPIDLLILRLAVLDYSPQLLFRKWFIILLIWIFH